MCLEHIWDVVLAQESFWGKFDGRYASALLVQVCRCFRDAVLCMDVVPSCCAHADCAAVSRLIPYFVEVIQRETTSRGTRVIRISHRSLLAAVRECFSRHTGGSLDRDLISRCVSLLQRRHGHMQLKWRGGAAFWYIESGGLLSSLFPLTGGRLIPSKSISRPKTKLEPGQAGGMRAKSLCSVA